ncbi:MAG TPA: D-alanyl-D-alanine carboxypeptidase family protein [Acetobacteraceae bacterium]|jgi:D-alanyl-D-alanine carboxypeptidase (penicillin-binding protein 5/6)
MLTRRILLLAGAAMSGPIAAIAAPPRHPAPAPGRAGKQTADAPPPVEDPAQTPVGPVDTAAKYAVAIDFTTGAVLLDKNADVPVTPSSMTKMMTAYVVYGMLKSGRLRLDQELPVSEKAWRMGGSKMFVPLGQSVKVEDLIRGMMIQSGNDACIVLAEGIAGSEDQFVELMNQKAKEIGLTHSTFRDATGWPDPEHHMSVHDIATVARRLIMDFPEYYHFDSEKSFKYNNIDQQNRNTLVQKGVADGLKTGHTEEGGYGMAVSALRDGRRVIVVVNGLDTVRARNEEAEKLLDWAFREFEDVTLFSAGDVIERAPVWLGTAQTVPLVGGRDVVVTLPRGWKSKANISVVYDSPIAAPITRGTTLGQLTMTGAGVPDMSLPLLAGADVERLGLPGRSMAVLMHMVTRS